MGKEKKVRRHRALAQQILDADAPKISQRTKSSDKNDLQDDKTTDYVESRLSHKILEQARLQQEELEEQYAMGSSGTHKKKGKPASGAISLGSKPVGSDQEDSDDELGSDEIDETDDICPEINKEDERAMGLFMSSEEQPRRTLADIIQEKIRDKETEIASQMTEGTRPSPGSQLDEKVLSVFKDVGKILAKYRSGKVPKAFKVIPSLSNWEEVLYITDPENWSAAAMFQATRIFVSNLSGAKAQRFCNLVLLPRVRDDISEYKRLNFHLYMALKKSLFKPAAFFKGILLPLCESGTCTLREAVIISSVMVKTSIPILHSSAAMLKIAEMDYSGSNSVFLRTLLDKKYALPYRVIDSMVFHFVHFTTDERQLPVLWHQSLLTFVQRYKEDISVDQKELLIELIRNQSHHDITPEIRREIVNSKCRDLGETFINRTQGSIISMQTD